MSVKKYVYKMSFAYKHIWFTVAFFVATILIGYFVPLPYLESVKEAIALLAESLSEASPIGIFFAIFLHNIQASAILFFGGIFFAFPTVFLLGLNGLMIGNILASVPLSSWWLILPHGVIEIPALLLVAHLGIKNADWVFKRKGYVHRFLERLTVFCLLLILFALAALIETCVFLLA
ncbi:MAG: stage II sporulation protein M [Candidatus Woesearchaeota archaeon]|jgi:stage II sporulation protein M